MSEATITIPANEGDQQIKVEVLDADSIHLICGRNRIAIDAKYWDTLDSFVRATMQIQESAMRRVPRRDPDEECENRHRLIKGGKGGKCGHCAPCRRRWAQKERK